LFLDTDLKHLFGRNTYLLIFRVVLKMCPKYFFDKIFVFGMGLLDERRGWVKITSMTFKETLAARIAIFDAA
jgi:hypothetical protein